MKQESYIKLLQFALILSWLSAGYLFFFKDPSAGTVIVTLFILSLFGAFFLTATLLLLWKKTRKSRVAGNIFPLGESMRQGLFISVFLTGLLLLSMFDLFNIFDAILLFITLVLAESFSKSRKSVKKEILESGSGKVTD